jgi:GH25 family lysozyme M1 (1,4-beta-N-acetylmuramidase)
MAAHTLVLLLAAAPHPAAAADLPARFTDGSTCQDRIDASNKVAYGIDTSKFQGDIDWNAVSEKTGVLYTLVRASSGLETDDKFKRNWDALEDKCILRAPYHFFVEAIDPVEQAKSLYDRLKEHGALDSELPVVADIERASATEEICGNSARAADFIKRAFQFIAAFEKAAENDHDRPMMIYTSDDFWNCLPTSKEMTSIRDLWIAEDTKAPAPTIPNGWTAWHFWQFYDKGKVAGIEGNVDADRFNGNGAALLKYAAGEK